MKKILGQECIWLLYCLAIAGAICATATPAEDGEAAQTYIVHMSKSFMPSSFESPDRWYSSLVESQSQSQSVLYNYAQVLHGFAVKLTLAQAKALEKTEGVLAVHPETVYELHTTHTPEFLGLDGSNGLWSESDGADDVVVGVLDTGVWPESRSFGDEGMKPVPSHWKGECESGTRFNASHCNKKLIGARFFCSGYEAAYGRVNESKEFRSPRDQDGHGTHTASTAAGSFVADASLQGYARGTARGMAPFARVAVYKVCWQGGCFSSDILAGMDHAVADGVNVLSMSLGGGVVPYYRDGIAVGAFTAMRKGIFVSCSAGNAGPDPMSLANVAPWITTVGAGTLDRDFPASIVLGNRVRYGGVSLYSGSGLPRGKLLPLIYAADASNGNKSSNLCLANTLDERLVKGKIVLCDRGISARVDKGNVVKSAGGAGMILANMAANGEELVADSHLLPAAAVGRRVGDAIRRYVKASRKARATIEFEGTVLGVKPSPVVAAFSSRGPSSMTPQILKPDVIGPGVNILAAWTGVAGPSEMKADTRRVDFNIISGTSMSCPHVSGVAALLKGAQPGWSPAAIRSALMTTAYTVDNTGAPLRDVATGNDSTPFDHGAGHVDPQRALTPGLVYDMGVQDYVGFLCALSYTPQQIRLLVKSNLTCTKKARLRSPGNLNYPSFSVVFSSHHDHFNRSATVVKYTRTVTNVGQGASKYRVAVSAPPTVKITVKPTTLSFQSVNQKRSYTVTFIAKRAAPRLTAAASFGSITWTDGLHKVRSPVAIMWRS
uniref:Subtilisin-like protease fibronectin type-III domain-containing protein n=1 Tax=Araucaria cunninghamii TaxID=56994 RepID=A0A0D6R414_ARACU